MADKEREAAPPDPGPDQGLRVTRWLTARRRLPWLLVGIAVLPTLAVALFAWSQGTRIVTRDDGQAVRDAAISAMVAIDAEIERTEQVTISLASGAAIKAMTGAAADDRLTSEVNAFAPVYRQAILVGLNGRVVGIARRPPGSAGRIATRNFRGKQTGKPSWFKIALRNASNGAQKIVTQTIEPRPLIGRLEGTGSAPLTPISAIAVMRRGKAVGVVAVFLNWEASATIGRRILSGQAQRKESEQQLTYVVDKDGQLLLGPRGEVDLRADLIRDPVVKEMIDSEVAGYDTDLQHSTALPGDIVAGYAPMDQRIGTPPLEWTSIVTEPTSAALTDSTYLREVLIVATLVVALLASLLALVVSRALTRRAERLRASSIEVEDGAKAMQTSAEASRERARLTEERAEQQLASMEQMTELVAEMGIRGDHIAEAAAMVAEQAGRASTASEEGLRAAAEVGRTMSEIDERVSGISTEIANLATQTAQIGEIVQTVSSIADQSNLLAFNATIEAAKAGEQGAGFAVVAEEVRMLAERSKRAAAQIRSILGEIDKAARDTERSSEQGIASVRTGRERAERAAATIDQLATANEEAEAATRGIAEAAPAQVEALGKIAESTRTAAQRAEELRSESHESSKSAAELDHLAERLRELATTLTNE